MTLKTCSAPYIQHRVILSLSHTPQSPMLIQTVGGTGAICPLADSQLCTNACRKLVSILTLEMTLQFVQLQWLVFCSSSLVGVWDQLDTCLALKPGARGTGPWNWRPGLACQPQSLSLSPSPGLASQVLITVPLVSLLCQQQSLAWCPWPLFLYSTRSCKSAPSCQQQSSPEQHQIPINSLPAFVPLLAAAASTSASSSVKSARCLCCASLSVLL